MSRFAVWIFSLLVLAVAPAGAQTSPARAAIDAALADSARPQADRDRDINRKPAECLAFAGVRPGDTVIELLPGRGYFTRIFSGAVGPGGKVFAVSPPRKAPADGSAPKPSAVQLLAADPHYANVTALEEPLASVTAPRPADLVWTSLNYHDAHNIPGLDMTAFNRSVLAALRPGGIYIVIDHAAAPGSGARDTNTLHRIDPALVKSEVLAAGFEFAGETDILRNPGDTHVQAVFDDSVRGHTDQFVLRFRRPESAPR